jgi:mannose-1-phosphate guanylyltransferase
MRHAVIMAGGAGVRLWPLSRQARPKQVLSLFGGKSLLRQAYERVAAMLPAPQIHIITNEAHLPRMAAELPELGMENLIGEPQGRDTAAAVGLASAILHQRDENTVVGIFTADHFIAPRERFAQAVEQAYRLAEEQPDVLVTLGIRPSRPDTNYGYIRRGKMLGEGVFLVDKFTEKPNVTSAMKYVASGEYYWNSGMFVWRAKTILEELRKQLPATYEAVRDIAVAWDGPEGDALLRRLYPTLMKISIDFAVMERAARVIVIEMDCHWVDAGSWPALESLVDPDAQGNVSACHRVVHLGSRGNIVACEDDHLIATLGVDDLVIVHAPDVTLICTRRDASSIKELVDKVVEKYGDQYH